MNESKRSVVLDLEVKELERRARVGGCSTSSSTSRLCTCPCLPPPTVDCVAKV